MPVKDCAGEARGSSAKAASNARPSRGTWRHGRGCTAQPGLRNMDSSRLLVVQAAGFDGCRWVAAIER